MHTGFKSYQCNKTVEHRNNLRSHILVKHNAGEKKFQCSECDKTFVFGEKLDQHVKRLRPISKKKPFMCEQCKMGLYRYSQWDKAISVRPLHCDKSFFYVIMNLLAI